MIELISCCFRIKNIFVVYGGSVINFVARAGVPMEVMGLMLGEFVDDYTITVVDVFAMP
jgi:hypothetical protein